MERMALVTVRFRVPATCTFYITTTLFYGISGTIADNIAVPCRHIAVSTVLCLAARGRSASTCAMNTKEVFRTDPSTCGMIVKGPFQRFLFLLSHKWKRNVGTERAGDYLPLLRT